MKTKRKYQHLEIVHPDVVYTVWCDSDSAYIIALRSHVPVSSQHYFWNEYLV